MANAHIADEPTDNPWKYLSVGIIDRALKDLSYVKRHGYLYNASGFKVRNDGSEIIRFFNSKWCDQLLSWADITPEQIQEVIARA